MRWILALFLILGLTLPATAQEGKDRITRFLQDALSGAGRDVQIEGFRGALSSRATMEKLTFADKDGIWLTLTDAVLDWNRAAMLGGRIEINQLSAAEIDVARLPASQGRSTSPEARAFALPDLPVSVRIDKIEAGEVTLGASVMGIATTLSVTGAVTLDSGAGTARLAITRTTGPRGSFTLDASYSNTTRDLAVDLALDEAADGVAATLLKLPGAPALELTVQGDAPVDAFAADIRLRSDGEDRLTGQVVTRIEDADTVPVQVIDTQVSGDLTQLFAPQYRPFFGPEVGLTSLVRLFPDGRVTLDTLSVTSATLTLDGNLALTRNRLPEQFNLTARLADPGRRSVLLPISGPQTRVAEANLTANFDALAGDGWTLSGTVLGLEHPGMRIDTFQLAGTGVIRPGDPGQIAARIDVSAVGLQLADGALAEALGPSITLGGNIVWREGEPLDISTLNLTARGLALTGDVRVGGLDSAITVDGTLRARIADLSRFSLLAGRPLTGSVVTDLDGNVAALTGAFDLDLAAVGTDLGVGIPKVDAVLQGQSRLSVSAVRDETGIALRSARVTANDSNARASGIVSTGNSDLQFQAVLRDIGDFVDGIRGPVTLTGRALENGDGWGVEMDAKAPSFDTTAKVQIAAQPGGTISGQIDADVGSAQLILPDLVQAGTLQLSVTGTVQPGAQPRIAARVDTIANGLQLADAALNQAIGDRLALGVDLAYLDGQSLDFSNLKLDANGLSLAGRAQISDLGGQPTAAGILQAAIGDLSRLSGLAKRPLGGQLSADLGASGVALDGSAFNFDLAASGTNLRTGIGKADALLRGESRLTAAVARNDAGLTLRFAELKTADSNARVSGVLTPGNGDVQFQALVGNIGTLVSGVSGPVSATGRAQENAAGWVVNVDAKAPYATTAKAQIDVPRDGEIGGQLQATTGALETLIPDLPGTVTLTASAQSTGRSWAVEARGQGAGGGSVSVTGDIARSFGSANLDIDGALPLALINRQIIPRSLQGLANFDLALNGPLGLASLSGRVRASNARLSLPELRYAVEQIDAVVDLSGSAAQVNISGNLNSGGRLTAQGRVGLTAPNATDLTLQLSNLTIRDPQLYKTNANGTLSITSVLPGSLLVGGQIVLDRTEVRISSTDPGAADNIPQIDHVNEPATIRRTREHAGLIGDGSSGVTGGGGSIGLDIRLLALNRIFVRGRGLDAELGGQLRLTGTTADIVPIGQFNLIRGHLNLLGKRLNLEEGSARLEGDLIPVLRLVAATTNNGTIIRVIIEGPANTPEIGFISEPELPGDEVVARLLFGRNVGSLSALQAVQLASAIATLTGRGGGGLVERLRENTGLDDLDVTTNETGAASLRAGKYILENVYTDVIVDSQGKSQIDLNLDLNSATQLRGTLGSDGRTGLGIFFEKDY